MGSCGGLPSSRGTTGRRPLWLFALHDARRTHLGQARLTMARLKALTLCLVFFVTLVVSRFVIPSTDNLRVLSAFESVPKNTGAPSANEAILSYPDANKTLHKANEDDRPYFILHVGPPKTATTTLQTELTKFDFNILLMDNYVYLGQRMIDPNNMWRHLHGNLLKVLKDRDCQVAVNKARLSNQTWPECWVEFLDTLEKRRKEGHSIILSEENFSIKYTDLKGGLLSIGQHCKWRSNLRVGVLSSW